MSIIRSHTALDLYQLKGEVPETVMTGSTSDISNIMEFHWYEWITFHDPDNLLDTIQGTAYGLEKDLHHFMNFGRGGHDE